MIEKLDESITAFVEEKQRFPTGIIMTYKYYNTLLEHLNENGEQQALFALYSLKYRDYSVYRSDDIKSLKGKKHINFLII